MKFSQALNEERCMTNIFLKNSNDSRGKKKFLVKI